MKFSVPSIVFMSSLAAHAAARLWPAKTRKKPIPDATGFFVEATYLSVLGAFYVLLPCLALFTPLLARFDYSAPAIFPWLSIPVFADSVWTYWLSHTGLGAFDRREGFALTQQPKLASLWIWTVGQSLCVPNCLGGVASLAAFGALCLIRVYRDNRVGRPIFVHSTLPAARAPAYLE